MRSLALVLAALCPAAVYAGCAGDTFLDCTVENGKQLRVCIGDTDFTYAFGPPDQPDIALSVPIADGTATPWPGIGGSIWSSIAFPADGFVYETWTSVQKDDGGDPPSGGVTVLKDGETVAALTCVSGTVSPAFTMEDALDARGWCWNFDAGLWQRKPSCG